MNREDKEGKTKRKKFRTEDSPVFLENSWEDDGYCELRWQ